jgi:hypothetical protein
MGPFYLIIPHLGGSFLRYQNQRRFHKVTVQVKM